MATVFRSAPSRRSCSSVIPVVSSVYSAEDVQTHSLIGRNVPDNYRDNDDPDPDRLAINDEVGEVIEVGTTPDINPEMFRRRVKSLMLAGLSQQEAEKFVASTPQKLELLPSMLRRSATLLCTILTRGKKSPTKPNNKPIL